MREIKPKVFFKSNTLPCFVSVLHTEQLYGGPEEGGWWYYQTARVENHLCTSLESFSAVMDRVNREYANDGVPLTSVASRGKFDVEVNFEPAPALDPPYRPHYE